MLILRLRPSLATVAKGLHFLLVWSVMAIFKANRDGAVQSTKFGAVVL